MRTALLLLTLLSSACTSARARLPPLAASHASTPPSPTAAPSASATAAPPVVEERDPCAHLEARSARALREDRAHARRSVETLVLRGADPLASQRVEVFTEVQRLRAAGDPAELARAEANLAELQRAHIAEQTSAQFGIARPVTANVLRFFTGREVASCWPAGAGAWGLVFDEVRSYPDYAQGWTDPWFVSARVVLAYSDAAGAMQTAPLRTFRHPGTALQGWPEEPLREANCCESGGGQLVEPETFDYDGDGVAEVFVRSSYRNEGHRAAWAELYTVRGGRLEPYPFARIGSMPLTGIEDLNGDSRPDPYSVALFSAGTSCGSGLPISGEGPRFPAMSEADGRLEFTSEAARAYARSWCPRAPATPPTTVHEVVCARLWGQGEAQLRRSLERRFDPWDCDAESDGSEQPSRRANRNYAALLGALEVPLPFRLTRP